MKIDINHVGKLSNLSLTDEEKSTFTSQLESILNHIENLQEVKTDNIKETSQVTDLVNVTRSDEALPSLPQEEALSQAKKTQNGSFAVGGILQSE